MNKKIIIISLAIIVVGGGVVYYSGIINPKEKEESSPTPSKKIETFEDCVSAGYSVLESYPRQCKTPNGKTFTEDIGNEMEKADLIRVDNPRPNQTIETPLSITGEARGSWFFEANFPIKLYDSNGNLITTAVAQAQDDWMTEEFVPYEVEIDFIAPETRKGVLVLEKANPSGLPENADELRMPVVFNPNQEMMTLSVLLNNSEMSSDFSCGEVISVERKVPKTEAVGRAALEELLKGPTKTEKEDGYFTSINNGVEIQSLIVEKGIARVDFNEQLEYQVGGSCRVEAIRAQITETLKQFPTINEVIISIDARTENILQP